MNKQLQKTISENKLIVLDVETASISDKPDIDNDLIVEIGITAINLVTGSKKLIYNTLVNEGITEDYKNSWVFQKTDIVFEDVVNAPPLDCEHIQKLLLMYFCTAFNKSFDFNHLKRRGFLINEADCLMNLLTDILQLPPTPSMIKWRPEIKYKNPNAQEAYDILYPHSGYIEIHRAGDDSFHEADIAKWLFDEGSLVLPKID